MSKGSADARRRRLYFVATLILPVAFLCVVELGLRSVGFGGSHPAFIDDPDVAGMRRANPELIRRYLHSAGEPIARIDPFPFASRKPTAGYRIVVQGGSTAAGFPFGKWGGLAGMLSDRLEATFPELEIEVISTAMAAVNSWTLADLVDEIIELEPDAVLVYAGHNEYLGVMGVGSALNAASSLGVTRLQLRMGRLRLYQLIARLVSQLREIAGRRHASDHRTLFELAASGASIAYGSALDEAGRRQLEANLGELLAKYRRAGIPVYVGTLVANEKDLPPFAGGPGEHVDHEAWADLLALQQTEREAGRTNDARRLVHQLIALDENAAEAWYALGELEREAGRFDAARDAFRGAKDRDRMRFRAPESFDRLIRELAQRHGATLVDVQERFAEGSPEGIVGDELLLEHVHPNAEGYFLLADTFYEALRRDRRIADWPDAPTSDEARRDMPITALDRVLADYETRAMKSGFPFVHSPQTSPPPAPANEIEQLAARCRAGEIDWIHAMEELLQIDRRAGRLADAARVARLAAQEYPNDRGPNYSAGALLAEIGQPRRARRYLERSLRAEPDDAETLATLVRVDLALEDAAGARGHLEQLRRVEPDHPLLHQHAMGAP